MKHAKLRIDFHTAKTFFRRNQITGINQLDYTIPIVFPKGTDPNLIDWSTVFKIDDNVDGTYEFKREGEKHLLKANPPAEEDVEHEFKANKLYIDTSAINFNQTGEYVDGVMVTATDRYDNTAERKFMFTYMMNITLFRQFLNFGKNCRHYQ